MKILGLAKYGKSVRLVGTHNNLNEVQSVKLVELGVPEHLSFRWKVKPATRIKSFMQSACCDLRE